MSLLQLFCWVFRAKLSKGKTAAKGAGVTADRFN